MKKYETADIKIMPAEITNEIMRSSSVQAVENLQTEQVERRRRQNGLDASCIFPNNVCLKIEKKRTIDS